MGQVRDTGHLNLDRNRNLALDLFGAPAWPLRNDLHVVVRNVGIGLDGQIAEGNDSPGRHYHDTAKHQPTIFQREVDKCANHLLVPRGLKKQCVGHDLLARFKSGEDFLPVAVEHVAGAHFGAPELIATRGQINPVAIMQMQDSVSWNHRVGRLLLAREGRGDKHAQPQNAGVGNLDSNLRRANARDQVPGQYHLRVR